MQHMVDDNIGNMNIIIINIVYNAICVQNIKV